MINTYMEGHKLFIDASGFIALISKKDKKHLIANTFFRHIIDEKIIQITTNLVISETYTFLRYQENYHISYRFLETIRRAEKAGFLLIIYSCSTIERKAMDLLEKFNDQELSYTDAVSFACIEIDQDIKDIFTLDKHFYITGRNIVTL